MLRGADEVFEYPMIDRDPVPTWVDGRVALLGDAAHVMYPTGSNGASQAIVDARVLGAAMIEHGVTIEALQTYDRKLCAEISAVVLRNRGAGPFGLLNLLDERCGGVFDDIDAIIPPQERDEFMSRYRAAAGFAMDRLNAAAPTIAPGAKVAATCDGSPPRAEREKRPASRSLCRSAIVADEVAAAAALLSPELPLQPRDGDDAERTAVVLVCRHGRPPDARRRRRECAGA
jgi:hypothetical protein